LFWRLNGTPIGGIIFGAREYPGCTSLATLDDAQKNRMLLQAAEENLAKY
jgi:hypothetical protein